MIEKTITVTTIDGKKIVLEPGGPQVLEVKLVYSFVDENGYTYTPVGARVVHVTREPLERAGLLPVVETKDKQLPPITTESLAVQLLERLGVKF